MTFEGYSCTITEGADPTYCDSSKYIYYGKCYNTGGSDCDCDMDERGDLCENYGYYPCTS
ncbi:MAG: hypothetical protein ACQESR_26930 [Planctomycetota bacterium]